MCNNLEKAVTLYRGDFLEGVNLRDCPEFDDWQYLEREGFHADLASALENLALLIPQMENGKKQSRWPDDGLTWIG